MNSAHSYSYWRHALDGYFPSRVISSVGETVVYVSVLRQLMSTMNTSTKSLNFKRASTATLHKNKSRQTARKPLRSSHRLLQHILLRNADMKIRKGTDFVAKLICEWHKVKPSVSCYLYLKGNGKSYIDLRVVFLCEIHVWLVFVLWTQRFECKGFSEWSLQASVAPIRLRTTVL